MLLALENSICLTKVVQSFTRHMPCRCERQGDLFASDFTLRFVKCDAVKLCTIMRALMAQSVVWYCPCCCCSSVSVDPKDELAKKVGCDEDSEDHFSLLLLLVLQLHRHQSVVQLGYLTPHQLKLFERRQVLYSRGNVFIPQRTIKFRSAV